MLLSLLCWGSRGLSIHPLETDCIGIRPTKSASFFTPTPPNLSQLFGALQVAFSGRWGVKEVSGLCFGFRSTTPLYEMLLSLPKSLFGLYPSASSSKSAQVGEAESIFLLDKNGRMAAAVQAAQPLLMVLPYTAFASNTEEQPQGSFTTEWGGFSAEL